VRKRPIVSLLAGAAVAILLPAIFAQSGKQAATGAGAPDITGVWQVDHYHPNLFPNKDAPFTPWGAAQFKMSDTNVNDPNLSCLPHGLPRLMYVPLPFEVFQVPGRVLMFQEGGNQLRQIHLDRQHPNDLDPTYNGDSIGKWEGDTLVVDSVGFNDITWLDSVGLRHSEALHVIERIHRVDHDTLQDDFTVEDPKAFTRPWTASQTYKLKPGWSIAEYTCDNNKYTYQPPK
jgi:hypothetical protein